MESQQLLSPLRPRRQVMKSSHIALAVLASLALCCLPVVSASASGGPCHGLGCDVSADQRQQAIKGRLLVPRNGFIGADRRKGNDCDNCSWALSPACMDSDPQSTEGCLGAAAGCGGVTIRLFIWLRQGAADWINVGSACFRPGAPRTGGEITPRVRDRFIDLLPKQHPTFQPKDGGLVNVPVVFAAGQVARLADPTFDLAGFSVRLNVKASWTWNFDDGTPETFTKPGGAYPNLDVSHTYVTSDDRRVTVTTTWDGTFTVDDLGPFDITGAAVTQVSAPMDVPIHQAKGQLVAD